MGFNSGFKGFNIIFDYLFRLIIYFVTTVLGWDTKNMHRWCEMLLCNVHHNFFYELFVWWWRHVKRKHVTM